MDARPRELKLMNLATSPAGREHARVVLHGDFNIMSPTIVSEQKQLLFRTDLARGVTINVFVLRINVSLKL